MTINHLHPPTHTPSRSTWWWRITVNVLRSRLILILRITYWFVKTAYYRPQTKCAKVMFLQVSVILSTGGGICGCSGGACMVAPRGASVVAPRGRAWLLPGVCGCSGGACMVAPGGGHVWLLRGHAWLVWGGGCSGGCAWLFWGVMHGFTGGHAWFFQWDTVNEQAVRILLECTLVKEINSLLRSFFANLTVAENSRFLSPANEVAGQKCFHRHVSVRVGGGW